MQDSASTTKTRTTEDSSCKMFEKMLERAAERYGIERPPPKKVSHKEIHPK